MSKLISHSRSRWYKSYRVTIKRSAAVLCRIFLCRDLQNKVLRTGKEKSMNIRNPVDYSVMYTGLDQAVGRSLPQMKLYLEIGKLVNARTEKGAAVAAAEYLTAKYPNISGFSPRNLRRMRDFFRTYETTPDILNEALLIGWTQNVVIMEADLSMDQRHWYLRAALQFGWSKVELMRQIGASAHEKMSLDILSDACYNDGDKQEQANSIREDHFGELHHSAQVSSGHIRNNNSGENNCDGEFAQHSLSRYYWREKWKSSLPLHREGTGRAWHSFCQPHIPPHGAGLLLWNRMSWSRQYAHHFWR